MLESIKIQKDHILKDIHRITVTTDTTTVTTGIRESDAEILLDAAFELNYKDALAMMVKIYLQDGMEFTEIQKIVSETINQY